MAILYGPFDAGAGANITESFWRKMADKWIGTGVMAGNLNELQIYADSTGMQVKVKTGHAWLRGHLMINDSEYIQPIVTSDPTNARIDRIVLSADFAGNTITIGALAGVAAPSPVAPTLTQTEDVLWQVSLAQIAVGAGVSTIAAGNVTDERPIMQPNLGTQTAIKTSNQSKTSTGLSNDTELWFWAEPNITYVVEVTAFFSAPQAGDIKFGWTVPAGCTGNWGGIGLAVGSTDVTTTKTAAIDIASTQQFGGVGSTTDMTRLWAVIHTSTTAGRVSLEFAQAVASGTTVMQTDSVLTARRVG